VNRIGVGSGSYPLAGTPTLRNWGQENNVGSCSSTLKSCAEISLSFGDRIHPFLQYGLTWRSHCGCRKYGTRCVISLVISQSLYTSSEGTYHSHSRSRFHQVFTLLWSYGQVFEPINYNTPLSAKIRSGREERVDT
jgi:hypothetical protein